MWPSPSEREEGERRPHHAAIKFCNAAPWGRRVNPTISGAAALVPPISLAEAARGVYLSRVIS